MESLNKYIKKGFLIAQNIVDNAILEAELGNTGAEISTTIASVKTPEYKEDDLISSLQGTASFLIAMPILLPYLRMVNGIMREKEKRIKEGMKIMGLKGSAFYLSWLIFYLIIFTIISLFSSSILYGVMLKSSTWGFVFLWHWLFSLATMSMGFFSTVFFSKAKVGNVFAFVLAFLFGWLEQLSTPSTDAATNFGLSFGPASSVSLSANHMFNLEAAEVGLSSSTVGL